LKKYSPEDAKTKKQRLTTQAAQKKDGKVTETTKPFVLKFGLNHVTRLI
jgi:large subunit ribosomal protein L7Ae